jgi:hypothetical protein
MLPQPLRGILVGVICLSVVLMIASGASRRYGSEEPESWGLSFVALAMFVGALVIAFFAKLFLALRSGRRPSFRIESAETRNDLRWKIKTLPVVILGGIVAGPIAIAISDRS